MAVKTMTLYLALALFGVTFSCGTADSSLSAISATYEKDCDRMLRIAKDQPNAIELSHVDCVFYDGGAVDKPTYKPIRRDKIYLLTGESINSTVECVPMIRGEILSAQCEGYSQMIDVGYIVSTGMVAINPKLSINIYLVGEDKADYFDTEIYTMDSAQKYGVITMSSK